MKNLSSEKIPINQQTPSAESSLQLLDVVDDEKPRFEWEFNLSTLVSNSSGINGVVSDTLGAIEFDHSDRLLATGGIARKIRIYTLNNLLPDGGGGGYTLLNHSNACEFYMCTPAKLSSLRWKPGGGGILGSGDYDGVIMEYDIEKRIPVFERDEHGGRRVWSMDYSRFDPVIGASGSDDGTMQIWDPRCDRGGSCLAKVQPSLSKSSVCCVEFSPFDGFLIAVGCADRKSYGYDVRRTLEPVFVLDGHQKPVTYVKFLDNRTIVTSAIDGTLKTWRNIQDRTMTTTMTSSFQLIRTFRGHVNSKRFVGLSVWRGGGLLCCGSEDNRVVVYDQRWGEPVWTQEFEPAAEPAACGFVSSVCWKQETGEDRCTLVAGGSEGVLQVFSGKRKRGYIN